MNFDEQAFRKWVKGKKRSKNTEDTYVANISKYLREGWEMTLDSATEFIETAMEDKSPTYCNIVCTSLNNYAEFLGIEGFHLQLKKIQKRQYLEDIISEPDYEFFLKKAEATKQWQVYLYARIAATTGMRMCEMLQIKREHIEHGNVDIYGKGAKRRRIYFPKTMREKVLSILDVMELKSGYVFSPRNCGDRPSIARGIARKLTNFAEECEIDPKLVHPHAFRHFFAKTFIRRYQNIALLADLMGHSNLETTRIYLKYTSKEQAEIINDVVVW